VFGSSFITRPDSAPWIDTPEFWADLASLWKGRDVVLVAGTERSLRVEQLVGVNDCRRVAVPRRDAYAEIDRIVEEIGLPAGPVLMCAGPTATVLAARLGKKGVQALDLGHIGMFMRHAGAYRYWPPTWCRQAIASSSRSCTQNAQVGNGRRQACRQGAAARRRAGRENDPRLWLRQGPAGRGDRAGAGAGIRSRHPRARRHAEAVRSRRLHRRAGARRAGSAAGGARSPGRMAGKARMW
jgi:hypothetical protein